MQADSWKDKKPVSLPEIKINVQWCWYGSWARIGGWLHLLRCFTSWFRMPWHVRLSSPILTLAAKANFDSILARYVNLVETLRFHQVENAYAVKRLVPVFPPHSFLILGKWIGCSSGRIAIYWNCDQSGKGSRIPDCTQHQRPRENERRNHLSEIQKVLRYNLAFIDPVGVGESL